MRTKIGCVALLAGMMGIVTEAAAAGENNASLAGKRGLSPITLAQYAPVIIAQATQAQDTSGTDRTIGVCHLVNSLGVTGRDTPLSPVYVISPAATVSDYINMFEKWKVGLDGKATLLNGPEHGVLKEDGEVSPWGQDYRYTPVANYIGADRATFLVEIGGLKVKVVYHLKVIDGGAIGGTEIQDKKNCPKGWVWKISTTSDANGNLVVTAVDYQPPITGMLSVDAATSLLNSLSVDPSLVTFSLADLGQ